jgi:hypothetical protein
MIAPFFIASDKRKVVNFHKNSKCPQWDTQGL